MMLRPKVDVDYTAEERRAIEERMEAQEAQAKAWIKKEAEKAAARKKIIKKTLYVAGEWYYWDTRLEQWKPETYKFEKSCQE